MVDFIAACLLFLLVILAFVVPQPLRFDVELGQNELGTREISFAVDADRVLLPGDCVQVRWEVAGVEAVYFNGQGVPGVGDEALCGALDESLIAAQLRVEFPNQSERDYELLVQVLALDPLLWLALALILLLLARAVLRPGQAGTGSVMLLAGLMLLLALGQFSLNLLQEIRNNPFAWDDAFMFSRYLYNWQTHGVLAWNIADGPAYGLTELLYIVPVALASLFVPFETPGLMVQLASFSMASAALILFSIWAWVFTGGPLYRRLLVLALIWVALASQQSLAAHFISGMGTSFAMLYLALFMTLARSWALYRGRWRALGLALLGGMAFLVRPDLLLFSFGVPAIAFIVAEDAAQRRRAFAIGALMLLVLAVQLVSTQLYFGSALPLPFYAKSTGIYDIHYESRYDMIPGEELMLFLGMNVPMLLLIALGLGLNRTAMHRRLLSTDLAFALAAAAYVAYYLFFVLQVMHYSQRFYYPILPVLVYFAIQGAAVGISYLQGLSWRLPRLMPIATGLLLLALVGPLLLRGWGRVWASGLDLIPQQDTVALSWTYARVWYEIQHFSRMGPDMIIATSDVGLPGIANYDWTVVDLASLNQREFIQQGYSAERLLERYAPDIIYMPGPDYVGLSADLFDSERFAAEYAFYPANLIGAYTDVALRLESPYYDQMQRVMEEAASP